MISLENVNIRGTTRLTSPKQLKLEQPATAVARDAVISSRELVKRILAGEDKRMFVIVGPCSIHDNRLAMDYAERLAKLSHRVSDCILPVMRVYFEKPRTTVGWKGLINDPHMNGTFDVASGIRIARGILRNIASLGLPAATEILEPITPQYIADLITQASIGARTTESPTHRQMASGVSMPVGFKNSTEGSLEVAINAMKASRAQHSFLGIDDEGQTCVVNTKGNPWGHLILRGGRHGPNYDEQSIAIARNLLVEAGLPPRLVVDCSHANSNKDYRQQPVVWTDVIQQRVAGNDTIVGLMLESNIEEGSQDLAPDPEQLRYGVSITDGCIGWTETEELILSAHEQLAAVAGMACA